MPKVAFKQADVARLVRGAIDGGMPLGSFAVQLVNGLPTIMPVDGPISAGVKMEASETDLALADIERLTRIHG